MNSPKIWYVDRIAFAQEHNYTKSNTKILLLCPLLIYPFLSLRFYSVMSVPRRWQNIICTNNSWFKEENEQLIPLQLSERITMVSVGLLKITKVRVANTTFIIMTSRDV